MKLSYDMEQLLRRVVDAGDEGLLLYSGRTTEALDRRGLVRYALADEQSHRLIGKYRYFATEAGRAAVPERMHK